MIKFNIVVPVYNAAPWIEKCLYSIISQQHINFSCVVIDDASTDDTTDILRASKVFDDDRFSLVINDKNVKALKNIVDGFTILDTKSDPNSVLMIIDGDDSLFSPISLSIINQVYSQHPNLLLTYGNWIGDLDGGPSNNRRYTPEVIKNNAFRDTPFCASHLRTFKSRLWHAIDDNDMRDVEGIFGEKDKYLEAAWDVVIMMPMLEMASERHLYIENVLYRYNKHNPLSEYKINLTTQVTVDNYVKKKKRYARLQ